ncbi:MAG: hypothetical protein E6R03_04955 [Hyphomicrobiaceae bacterium]|nr:MAG: hypothetical protein E6R03_04955 [Hyphomicrobiaceae bacterium]
MQEIDRLIEATVRDLATQFDRVVAKVRERERKYRSGWRRDEIPEMLWAIRNKARRTSESFDVHPNVFAAYTEEELIDREDDALDLAAYALMLLHRIRVRKEELSGS